MNIEQKFEVYIRTYHVAREDTLEVSRSISQNDENDALLIPKSVHPS